MKCDITKVGDMTVIICGRGRNRHACESCGRSATIQCDFSVTRDGKAGTCDRWCCRNCAVRIGANRDYCLPHHRHTEKQAELKFDEGRTA